MIQRPSSLIRYAVFIGLSMIILASCRTTTLDTQSRHLTDTIHVTLTDTLRHTHTRDTTIVTHREYITEHIIQRYDPTTGHLTEQDITRSIRRRADSLAIHLLDSLMHAQQLDAARTLSDTLTLTHHQEQQPQLLPTAPRPLWQRILCSSLVILLLILILVWHCVRTWRK